MSNIETALQLIDGIQMQLNAVKQLLTEKSDNQISCRHNDMTTIETMAGIQGAFCNDCGAEFGVGVLDKPINNE